MMADLHIHTKYSYDSLLKPEKILKTAKKRGLDIIAITDHDTIRGGVETYKHNNDNDLHVIVGCEINTEAGDIIGLYLNEEIKSRKPIEVIEEIRSQGGYVILPHPFRGHNLQKIPFHEVDAIEVYNSRSTLEQNANALKLAKELRKPLVAGSDAHFALEIGLCSFSINNYFEEKGILSQYDEKLVYYRKSLSYLITISQTIKSIKQNL